VRNGFASFCLVLVIGLPSAFADGSSGLRGSARGPGDIDAKIGLPKEIQDKIGIDQKLGNQVPLQLEFVDESGKTVKLGDFFTDGKPVIFVPAYYRCRLICNRVLDGMFDGLKRIDAKFRPSDHFEVVVLSMDPTENAEHAGNKKESMLSTLGRRRSVGGWHFLTGSEENIKKVMDSVGYRYIYDEKRSEYLHATGVMILTPEGIVSRYLMGIRYMPTDLELSLVESSKNNIGTLADQIKLLCYAYDPRSGQYNLLVIRLVQAGALATIFSICFFWFWSPLVGLFKGSNKANVIIKNVEVSAIDGQTDVIGSSHERQA
jgi:protein SCO1/2